MKWRSLFAMVVMTVIPSGVATATGQPIRASRHRSVLAGMCMQLEAGRVMGLAMLGIVNPERT